MANSLNDPDLEALLREFDASDLAELHIKTADYDLFLSTDPHATAPGSAAAVTPSAPGPAASPRSPSQVAALVPSPTVTRATPAHPLSADAPPGCIAVRAPYFGTFYRSPKPGEPNFVEVGQTVEEGTDLCLVEVMKLFTAVRSTGTGKVREIYAIDGQMVEEGQLLFAIDPGA